MAQLPDEQLLDIVTRERRQYRQVALEIADAELRRRGLTATAANLAATIASQQAKAQPVARTARSGQDIITGGCLRLIGLVFLLSITADLGGFSRWFWPGLLGYVFTPLVLAGLFGAAGWLLMKLKHKP
ncbi:MAG: hypothetical protein DMF64_17635 [Acidobacteria bacterium]|nr:MAG: hypothetical protein DMF64_17635 [Acidobacteriota bacterium]